MAKAAVSFVLERLADIIDQIEVNEGLHREVERLRAELKRMQCFLKDMDAKQEDDDGVCNWVSDISNVAYDALRMLTTETLPCGFSICSTMAWECLAKAFPTGSNGSGLMLCNNSVALYADAQSAPHELQLQSKEDSWELFCKKTFIDSIDRVCPPQLEEIGGEIIAECAGLLLAIIVLGGLLSRERRFSEWERDLNTIHSLCARCPNGVSAILAVSYIDLPHYLKFCFLYLGLFRLWIAEDLIPQHGERMEGIAEDYLNELIDRTMVQVAVMSPNFEVPCLNYLSAGLRPLLFFGADHQRPGSYSIPGNLPSLHSISRVLKLLTVLVLEDMKLCNVPNSIGTLTHLKYLGLRHNNLHELPSEIRYLSNLQTLDIAANFNLRIVPNAISKMRNLRHLCMSQAAEEAEDAEDAA